MSFELADEITDLIKKLRPVSVLHRVYGQYSSNDVEFMYDDSENVYKPIIVTPSDKEVGSVGAFVEYIKEDLRRRNNSSGEFASVQIGSNGGIYFPDDNFGRFKTKYVRLHSQQWNLIKNSINREMTHKQFIEFLSSLKPSIEYFEELFSRFAQIRLIGNSTLTSQPVFINDGTGESGYKCTYKLESGGAGESILPFGFFCNCSFTKAGERKYDIPIELLFLRNLDDELRIKVMCPLWENIEEQAIIDESNFIKEETKDFDKLLVLSDF